MIQEHAASSRHFDLRMEVDGVLASWAVPKGLSTDPREQRLAIRTEDHPLAYADFEGHVPEGEYGAGEVIVWDIGPYRNLTQDDQGDERPVAAAIEAGHLKVWLEGDKLRGGFALTHAPDRWRRGQLAGDQAGRRGGRRPTPPASTQPESVLSGRTVDDLTAAVRGDDGAPDIEVATLGGGAGG